MGLLMTEPIHQRRRTSENDLAPPRRVEERRGVGTVLAGSASTCPLMWVVEGAPHSDSRIQTKPANRTPITPKMAKKAAHSMDASVHRPMINAAARKITPKAAQITVAIRRREAGRAGSELVESAISGHLQVRSSASCSRTCVSLKDPSPGMDRPASAWPAGGSVSHSSQAMSAAGVAAEPGCR